MKKKRTVREITDDNYYKAKELLLNPSFQKKVQWLKDAFKKFGCELPVSGFKNYQEYMDWNTRYWKTFTRVESSQEYKDKIHEITGGKSTYGSKEYFEMEEFKDKFLPPVYGEYIDSLLEEFGIDKKYAGFQDFLEQHIFFNKNTYSTPFFNIVWKRNDEKDRMELFIQLFGHTRKEDILNAWDEVKKDQKLLPDYTERTKPWPTFERDQEIYRKYREIKDGLIGRRASLKKGELAIDDQLYSEFLYKYPELNLDIIRDAIKKVKDLRGGRKDTA